MNELRKGVEIPFPGFSLAGDLVVAPNRSGVVLFAHGSGSSRYSPRNQHVARILHGMGIGTLLFDLLTEAEEESERHTRHLRFDIPLLADRLSKVTEWFHQEYPDFLIGYFGSSTGAAAALVAEARSDVPIRAIVSRGGRPDLAEDNLPHVKAPTLLIVGGEDTAVLELNRQAYARLNCPKELRIIPGATHLFEEPGALDTAAEMAADWFGQRLTAEPS